MATKLDEQFIENGKASTLSLIDTLANEIRRLEELQEKKDRVLNRAKTVFVEISHRAPGYDLIKYLDENWSGTIIDILKDERIPAPDRLWTALRTEFVSERTMRLFAVWCARQVQHLRTDPRSLNALEVSERFANGQASTEELTVARDAAGDAARDAAWSTTGGVARETARETAGAAAREAALEAAQIARKAAWVAREATWTAAGTVARDAARAAQIKKLIEMIEDEGNVAAEPKREEEVE